MVTPVSFQCSVEPSLKLNIEVLWDRRQPAHARLHAFCATAVAGGSCATPLTELYNSHQNVTNTSIGPAVPFLTPTVFNGRVDMGTKTEVDVFGLCPPSGVCPLQ